MSRGLAPLAPELPPLPLPLPLPPLPLPPPPLRWLAFDGAAFVLGGADDDDDGASSTAGGSSDADDPDEADEEGTASDGVGLGTPLVIVGGVVFVEGDVTRDDGVGRVSERRSSMVITASMTPIPVRVASTAVTTIAVTDRLRRESGAAVPFDSDADAPEDTRCAAPASCSPGDRAEADREAEAEADS